ncbi:MAG TPA: spore coat protein U domain-containing protein [Variovorax sp.]|nr:spore coat protein U domain-containing protein [Variovorax sp.]
MADIAHSGTVSQMFNVTAKYQTACAVNNVSKIDFGTLVASSSPSNGTYSTSAQVIVACTSGTSFGIWIPLSSNANGTQRRMLNTTNNTSMLNYNLYLDNFATLAPTTQTTNNFLTWSNNATVYGIKARIPSGQTLAAGAYLDNIVVMVSY